MRRNGLRAVISCTSASSAAAFEAAKPRSSTAPGANGSFCIMEDHTERMAVPGAQPAHAVTEVDAVHPTRAGHRPMMDGEDHRIAAPQWHDLGPRLHPGSLLGEDELTAREVLTRLRQQNRHLQ